MTDEQARELGIDDLAGELTGDEVIDAGWAPTWQVGVPDRIALVAQPIRLGRAVAIRGEPPRLQFDYVLLDWSTEGIRPAPKAKILLFAPDPAGQGCHENAADHWESVATQSIDPVGKALIGTESRISRISAFKSNADFRAVLRLALNEPSEVFAALEGVDAQGKSGTRTSYAAPVCRACGTTATAYEYIEGWDRIQSTCAACGQQQEADIRELDYRVDRRVLSAALAVALRPAARLLTESDFDGGDVHKKMASLAERSNVTEPMGDIPYVVAPSAIIEPADVDLDVEELVLLARRLETTS
jgi:hypothetical protein